MFQCRQALFILRGFGCLGRFLEHGFVINSRHTIDPLVISFDWSAESNAMLLDDVAKRLRTTLWKRKIGIEPVIYSLFPQIAP